LGKSFPGFEFEPPTKLASAAGYYNVYGKPLVSEWQAENGCAKVAANPSLLS